MKCRAAIYCRLSKEDVNKERPNEFSESIRNQEAMLLQYAADNDFKVVRIYRDDDFSGLYDDRPAFENLLADAKAGYFDVIIAKTQSRFTRNMEHLEKYIHNEFVQWGIRFIGMVDHVDTELKGNKKSRQINGLINEWYCEDLSESIKASFHIKQLQGQFLGQAPPYGYLKDPNNNHHLIPDPYASQIIKRIFNMYLSGIGKQRIGRILTQEGVLRPSIYKRDVLGLNYHNPCEKRDVGGWNSQTISEILSNEVYLGHTIQNKWNKVSYKSKHKRKLPRSEWIIVKNTHEPIIEQEIFDAAQQVKITKTCTVDATPNVTLFWKKLFCTDCGKSMVKVYSRNKYGPRRISYMCKTYKFHGNALCSSHRIDEETLSGIVLEAIKKEGEKLLNDEEINKLHIVRVHDAKNELERQLNETIKRLEKTVGYKEKLYEDYADGIITKEDYKSLKKKYEKKECDLKETISNINTNISMLGSDKKSELNQWIEQFKNYMNITELKREVVEELIDKIEIGKNMEIIIHFKFHE